MRGSLLINLFLHLRRTRFPWQRNCVSVDKWFVGKLNVPSRNEKLCERHNFGAATSIWKKRQAGTVSMPTDNSHLTLKTFNHIFMIISLARRSCFMYSVYSRFISRKSFPFFHSVRGVNFSRFLSNGRERVCLLVGGFDHDSWMLNCADADAGKAPNLNSRGKKSLLHSDSSIFFGAFFARWMNDTWRNVQMTLSLPPGWFFRL